MNSHNNLSLFFWAVVAIAVTVLVVYAPRTM